MATFKFSTSGFRGKIGKELNPELALQIGQAIGGYLPARSAVFCGRDNRRTSSALLLALISGLTSTGSHRILFSMEPVPTAAGVRYAGRYELPYTVFVTGSHLPREDNGIIFFEDTDSYFSGILHSPDRDVSDWERYTDAQPVNNVSSTYRKAVQQVRSQLFAKAEPVVNSILIDTANGPAGLFLPELLQPLCNRIVRYNCELDDRLPNRPSEPSPENLARTAEMVVKNGCALGLATDMDADRAVFILRDGSVLNGDTLGILLAGWIWGQRTDVPVVATLNSTLVLGRFADKLGGTVRYTPVGPPSVIHEMKRSDAEFGFEGNGKYMFRRYSLVPDAAVSAMVVLALINERQQFLEEMIQDIPKTVYRSEKVPFQRSESERFIAFLKAEQGRSPDESPVRLDDSDGLKLSFADRSWLMIRPSGTENVVRVMVESLDVKRADELVARGLKLIEAYRRSGQTMHTAAEGKNFNM